MQIIRKHFHTIGSTNTWAKREAHTFNQACITLITADEQTAGRGRFNRTWVSPPKQNIYASFCFFTEKSRTDIGNLPQILAISVVKVLEKLGFQPKLKWPNDILLGHKKTAGILCETTAIQDQLCVILGVGVNVNMPVEILEKIDRPATSLLAVKGEKLEAEMVLALLQKQFAEDLSLFLKKGFSFFLEIYKQHMEHQKGDPVQFHDNQKVWQGTFQEINADGTLNLELSSGEVRRFISGEFLP